MDDARISAPSATRNRDPILSVLLRHLPPQGRVLEIASGSGEHVQYIARAASRGLVFQPSDPDPAARVSIDAWTNHYGQANIEQALTLDAASDVWPVTAAAAVLCINMIHIAPWAATVGLVRGAARILPQGGLLYLYGPYHRGGQPTAPGNAVFDAELRRRNPAWGVRDLEAVTALTDAAGFGAPHIETMPANNLSLILRRGA
jgi:SAM-dependent methyltransferase